MDKAYDHKKVEDKIYDMWQASGYFNPDNLPVEKDAEPFSIVLPPPNVTGALHMGHAFEDTLQDIIIRFQRMRGKKTLWVPGTDHAAIATQAKFEKDLHAKEKKTRHDFSRQEFFGMIQEFALANQSTILGQLHKLGLSLDWSRLSFTLDEKREKAVRTAFKKMYDTGLIYRGDRIVNWDPVSQTTVADDEIEYKEQKDPFYYFQYGPFVIGTVRPETKFGDKYVVMHPDDKRYEKYNHGDTVKLEWINGPITATVIKDHAIDMEKGSGVMTITPSHSEVDFEIAKRHGLDIEQVIDDRGILLPIAGEFAGQHIKKARSLIVEKLQKKGLVVKIDTDYLHSVATNYRGSAVIEPQIKRQWFVDVNKEFILENSKIPGIASGSKTTLKQIMTVAIKSRAISIFPKRFEKTYFHWIDNLRDWCISRQIIYGHQVPVWYKGNETYCGVNAPKGDGWEQDTDTLDTWFSSGLWTFSTLGWPEETLDFKTYHPTSVIMPGYEILFFWVARMILMSGFLLGDIPFKKIFLHGIVRDKLGRKFSKSLNNGVDPLDMIEKYGTDALRFALVFGAAAGNDVMFDEQKIQGMKNFVNKLWNMGRFIEFQLEQNKDLKLEVKELSELKNLLGDQSNQYEEDSQMVKDVGVLIKDISRHIDSYQFNLAAESLYDFSWHKFADLYIEHVKQLIQNKDVNKQTAFTILVSTYVTILKLLHPFMPFVTEEILQKLYSEKAKRKPLIISPWPEV